MKFQNVKVGDKLWSIQLGDCEVVSLNNFNLYILECRNKNGLTENYTLEGFKNILDEIPSLFFSKPEIIEPKKKVTKTVEVWVNVDYHSEVRAYSDEEELSDYIDELDIVKKAKGILTYEIEE